MTSEVVAAFITKGDKFMICQRPARQSHPLLWEFVGGKIEIGETPQDALIRECMEEMDIEVSVGEILTEIFHDYSDKIIHLRLYNAEIISGEPKMIEPNDIRWITCDEIENFEFCLADIVILDRIKQMYKQGLFPKQ